MPQFRPEKFLDFVSHFQRGNESQERALIDFAQSVIDVRPELMADEANWVIKYRTPNSPAVLKVPYFSQLDNYRDAARTCFSSSCAMLLEFLKPGTLPGAKGDDVYVRKVFSFGDTTDSATQIKALSSFGLKASFTTKGTFLQLDNQLKSGKPVPIGILHHGPSNAPSGGGHWVVVIGKVEDSKAPGGCWYVVNDPYGELSNSDGTYISTNGKDLRYSKSMLEKRWTVEGDGTGYAIIA